MFNKFPKRSGIYHINDNIKHLELEINFNAVKSLLELPKFEVEKARNKNQHTLPKEVEEEVKSVHIKWQQKILSLTEVELYKDLKNCVTDKQKEYHQWLQQQLERALEDVNTSARSKSKRRQKRQQQKKAKQAEEQFCRIAVNEIFTYIQEDNHLTEEQEQETEKKPLQTMYIYAALNPPVQLVALKWHPEERILHIYPDFNNFKDNPYFIEIDADYRHLYAYDIRHTSKMRQSLHSGVQISPALGCLTEAPVLPAYRNSEFAFPPKHTQRVVLLLEICEAGGFENDNIHVRYHVHLPQGLLVEEGLLEASTHSSSAAAGGCHFKKRHNFGYCWQLTLLCENYDASDLLHIYFEVISIDSWQRERIEGYAHFSTYLLTAGSSSSQLQCLRPIESFWFALNRYFIGGWRKFDYVRFFTETELAMHNRFGCRMTHTGYLELKCQRLVQRSFDLLKPCKDRSTNGMTLDDIMMAYCEARKRLELLMVN